MDTIIKYVSVFPSETEVSIAIIKGDYINFVGVKKEDTVLYYKEYRNSVFEIGSITKVFTATLLTNLIMEQTIQLDEPIIKTLPYNLSVPEAKAITYKMLANHTSGLPRISKKLMIEAINFPLDPYSDYDNTKLEAYLKYEIELDTIPGSAYSYSNMGAGILGYLMEMKAKKPYETLLQEKIFSKYGMNTSTTIRENVEDDLIEGLDPFGEEIPSWNFKALKSAGAILSDAEDLSKFVIANFSHDSILAFQRQKTFSVNENMDMALGWHILNVAEGSWYWHNGGSSGYTSSLTMDADKKYAVIVLSNVSPFHPLTGCVDQLGWSLMRTIK